MPEADAADHLNEPTGMTRGKIDTFHFESKIMENSRKVEVYLPPGYSESGERYPTVYVNYGQQAKDWGKMTNTLDNLIGKTIRLQVRFRNARLYALRGAYHFLDALDVAMIGDGKRVDTSLFDF